jgi:hypothetical protein
MGELHLSQVSNNVLGLGLTPTGEVVGDVSIPAVFPWFI